MTTLPETTVLVWHCRRCDKSCKVQPPNAEQVACTCDNPVTGLRPTRVTLMHLPKPRPIHALTDEEARLRALGRKGTRVRVTFEGEIADAWQWSNGISRGLDFIVKSPDGRTHPVNADQPGLHIEAITGEESAS